MKTKTILTFFAILCLWSCTKDVDANRTQSIQGEISYDINGVRYTHKGDQPQTGPYGINSLKFIGTPGVLRTYYSFNGSTDMSSIIAILLITDTLKTKTYRIVEGDGFSLIANHETYGTFGSDYLDVNINSFQGGIVNATFAGKITKIISVNPNVTQPAIITNGVIKNVVVNYK